MAAKEEATAEELKKATDETLTSAQKIAQVMQQQAPQGGEGVEVDLDQDKKKDEADDKGDVEEGEVVD